MEKSIEERQTLNEIERNIENEIKRCEFWGDLELSLDELSILKERLKGFLSRPGATVYSLCKLYPHAITTYMVFFVRYKYNVNFWGVISEELDVDLPQFLQGELGRCAKRMFAKYRMDISETKDETKRRIAPIMYEACLPPESSLDDLFYILTHDTIRAFDPQIIIEELLEMRSYSIRKPMLRFLQRFKEDRALDFLLEVRDAMMAVEQQNSNSSRFVGNYIEWKEEEKSKAVISNRKNSEYQARPYLYFDNGNKGLCIVLPQITMESEWVEEVVWRIKGSNGFFREIYGSVLGDEGRRYTDVLVVSVAPSEKYIIDIDDLEGLDDKGKKEWEIEGIKKSRIIYFNNSGRQINANYLLSPYGIMIIPNNIKILKTYSLDLLEQYYPMKTDEYRIVSASPLSNDAVLRYQVDGIEYSIVAKPQICIKLEGKTLFSLPASLNVFTKIPSLIITVDGELSTEGMILKIGGKSIPIELNSNEENVFNLEKIAKSEFKGFGTYSIRIYRFGKFVKQVEFKFVPGIKTNYSPILNWPALINKKEKQTYKFQRLEDWELDFEGCVVGSDDDNYYVTISPNSASVFSTLKSQQTNFLFECRLELPIRPFEAEIVDTEGVLVENVTDKTFKTGIDGFLDEEKWISFRTFGEYKLCNYQIRLRTANGIEQTEMIRLAPNGTGNFNLAAFNETIRRCPLPAELELICNDDEEKTSVLILVSEKLAMEKKVNYKRGETKSYIMLGIEDDGKDIYVRRFGFDQTEVSIPYSESVLSKTKKYRGYLYPKELKDGIYDISGSKEQAVFEFEQDGAVDLTVGNNVIIVTSRDKDKAIENVKEWLDKLIYSILYSDPNVDLLSFGVKKTTSNCTLYRKSIRY